MSNTLHIDREASTTTVTLTRAHCLDIAGKAELVRVFDELGREPQVRAIVLAAAHPAALLVDVAELVDMTPADALAFSRDGHRLADTIAGLSIPVIAAVDGPALGGGCELVLSCDVAIAGERATFGQIEANGGVIPGFGGGWRLVRRVGFQRACELIYSAAVVDAATAARYGLVLEAVSSAALLAKCRQLAEAIGKTSRDSVATAKRVLADGWSLPPAAASALEQSAFASLFGTDDQRGRMRAFLQQQKEVGS